MQWHSSLNSTLGAFGLVLEVCEMTFSEAKYLATIVGTIVVFATLVKGVIEYTAQGAQKRAEQFLEKSLGSPLHISITNTRNK